ncbi:MAG: hypothetical protein QX197_08135 [Methylococcaceae bacterium]
MNRIVIVIVAGLILLYFLDAAFKLPTLQAELLTHSAIRFCIGFFIMGIGVFYAHTFKLKSAVYFTLAVVLADDVWDYFRQVDSFKPEVMLHSIYILLWGAVTGYVVMKHIRGQKEKDLSK